MRVLLKDNLIVLVPQTAEETAEIGAWKSIHGDHVFCLRDSQGASVELHDLGPRAEACREPINVVSTSADPIARTISNFAATPFELDGQRYQSVESFWQGFKFGDDADRRRLAALDGAQARDRGRNTGLWGNGVLQGRDHRRRDLSALAPDGTRLSGKVRAERRSPRRIAGDRRTPVNSCGPSRQRDHTGRDHGANLDADTQAHQDGRAQRGVRVTEDTLWTPATPTHSEINCAVGLTVSLRRLI